MDFRFQVLSCSSVWQTLHRIQNTNDWRITQSSMGAIPAGCDDHTEQVPLSPPTFVRVCWYVNSNAFVLSHICTRAALPASVRTEVGDLT